MKKITKCRPATAGKNTKFLKKPFHNSDERTLTLTASGSPSIEGRVMETGDGTVILDRVPIVTPSGDVVVPSLVRRKS